MASKIYNCDYMAELREMNVLLTNKDIFAIDKQGCGEHEQQYPIDHFQILKKIELMQHHKNNIPHFKSIGTFSVLRSFRARSM